MTLFNGKMTPMVIDDYLNWSYIDAKPVIFFNEDCQEWLAFWNGVYMTAEIAYLIATHYNLKYKPTPESTRIVMQKYSKLYYAGIFNYGKKLTFSYLHDFHREIGAENINIIANGDNVMGIFKEFLKDARNN